MSLPLEPQLKHQLRSHMGKCNTLNMANMVKACQTLVWCKKRSISDIFTPYSVSSIGDTANKNYQLMNKNLQSVHTTEMKLAPPFQ